MENFQSISVWLVDDDEEDRQIFLDALTEIPLPAQLFIVKDCTQLEEMLFEVDLPDILFLDISMPERNGFECLEWIKGKATLKNIPVVMYTTSSRQEDIQKAFQLGAHSFFTKPASFKKLKSILSHLLRRGFINNKADFNSFVF